MSRTLAEALDEVAEEVATTDVRSDLAALSWQRGRRRRVRARLGGAAAVAAVAAAVVTVVALVLPGPLLRPAPPAGEDTTVGHPQRIGRPLVPQLIRQLPERGTPLAGVAFAADELDSAAAGTWYAVGQGGELWDLPIHGDFLAVTVPAISRDGRRLAYTDESSERYVIRDVVSGRVTRFPTVGMQPMYAADPSAPTATDAVYRTHFQAPVYFSPDGTRVAVPSFAGKAAAPVLLVLGADGSLRELPMEEGLTLAGWLDDDSLLTLRTVTPEGSGDTVALQPVVLSLDGTQTPLPRLSGEGAPIGSTTLDRWCPSLSPDRQTLLLALDDKGQGSSGSAGGGRHLLAFDLETGTETLSAWTATGAADSLYMVGTPVEWRDDRWALPRLEAEGLRLGLEGDARPDRALVVTDPRLQLTRLDLADDALSGPAHTTIWGTSVSTLSWRWPEAVLVVAVALGVLLWLRRRRSVRTRAQAG